MGHTFSSLKIETIKIPILHSKTYPTFFTPRDKEPNHSSSEETSSEFDLLEIKINMKEKQSKCSVKYISSSRWITYMIYDFSFDSYPLHWFKDIYGEDIF